MPITRKGGLPAPGHAPQEEAEQAPAEESPTPPAWPELTQDVIDECKRRTPDRALHKYVNVGQTFVFKPLLALEWQALAQEASQMKEENDQDVLIAKRSVVWPVLHENFWNYSLAGHASSLALQIRKKSGFVVLENGIIGGDTLEVTEIEKGPEKSAAPTDEELQELKDANPRSSLFAAKLGDNHFVFRPIFRQEWVLIQGISDRNTLTAALQGCKAVVLWPKNIQWDTEVPAGLVDQLFDAIIEQSGFSLTPQVMTL